jgi:hypothetical protein
MPIGDASFLVLPWGIFGENLTTGGLDEDALQIGDHFRIGTAKVVVTQPRLPCFKLELRFGRDDMVKRFLASGRLGFYFRVVTEGDIAAGDEVLPIERAKDSLPVVEITRLYARDKDDLAGLQRMVRVAALPEDWRDYFKEQIQRIGAPARRPAAQRPAWTGFRPFLLRQKLRESHDVSSFHLVPDSVGAKCASRTDLATALSPSRARGSVSRRVSIAHKESDKQQVNTMREPAKRVFNALPCPSQAALADDTPRRR